MKSVTTDYRETLKGPHKRLLLVDLEIGTSTYYISNADVDIIWNGNTYAKAYLKEIDDVEMTSDPKVNDVEITLDNTDRIFGGLFLSESWMNKSAVVTRLIIKNDGTIAGGEKAFVGLLSDYAISYEGESEVKVTASSIWKDFEKVAGIKNNTKSQQRFYPGDTALDHVYRATREIYWGREKPRTTTSAGSRDISGSRFGVPGELP